MKVAPLLFAMAVALTTQGGMAAQPYAGQQDRAIKAMSPDEVIGHLEGRGLGYAKAAELNHLPGPLHLRELQAEIGLKPDQLAKIKTIEAAMKADAIRLGAVIVEKERALDQLFASGRATPDDVKTATIAIGKLKGELRAVHLNAHVAVRPYLSRHQVMLYDRLRGYGSGGQEHHQGGHHGH